MFPKFGTEVGHWFQQRVANRELQRLIARGALQLTEYKGRTIVVAMDPDDFEN